MLNFTDGVSLPTGGDELKIVKRMDGYYVVGCGMTVPVDSLEEGAELIKELGAK